MKQLFFSLLIFFFIPFTLINSQNSSGSSQLLPNDIAVGPFLSLPAQFFTGNAYPVKARVTNAGTVNQSNIPMRFSVNGTLAGTGSIPFLNAGAVDSAIFMWTPPAPGNYTLRIYSVLANDENRLNDTVTTAVYVLPAGSVGSRTVVCKNGMNKLIPDNYPPGVYDTININIPNACVIWDVNVVIDTLTHTWVSDLIFSIRHNNTIDTIFKNQGGSGDNFIGAVFNDSAGLTVPPAPFTGNIRPFRPLYIFNGQQMNGTWILHLTDVFAGDTGYLKAWCLQIVYQTCLGIFNSNEIPRNYFLSQNYPNPFNPATAIYYGIPVSGNVSIKVYDIIGREVVVLVNEFKQPGMYKADFDGSDLTSGVYIYRLTAGDPLLSSGQGFVESKKMVLIK